jgi:hypothetical protein
MRLRPGVHPLTSNIKMLMEKVDISAVHLRFMAGQEKSAQGVQIRSNAYPLQTVLHTFARVASGRFTKSTSLLDRFTLCLVVG